MTVAERAFIRRLERRASAMEPTTIRELLRAYEAIRDLLSERELAAAIRSGELEALLFELVQDDVAPEFRRLRFTLVQDTLESAGRESRILPGVVRSGFFNRLSPFVVQAADQLATRVIEGLKTEIAETVRQAATDGLREGVGPRTVARRIRSVVGLAPNQEAAVANFRRMLEAGDREALTRALRDKRFDRTLDKALGRGGSGLTAEQVERMTSAYRRKMLAFNAETHARTVALDAQKLAQRLAWQDAIDRGVVSRDALVREWVAVGGPEGDGRNRPEHLALHGTRVGFDEPFPNGELEPGESTYNCRCVARVIHLQARMAA